MHSVLTDAHLAHGVRPSHYELLSPDSIWILGNADL